MAKTQLTIKNTSKYPTPWVNSVLHWLAEELGVPRATIEVRHRDYGDSGRAWLGARVVLIRASRRKWVRSAKYRTMRHDDKRPIHTALEAFVHIAAHEVAHICPEGIRIYNTAKHERSLPGRRHWCQRMELRIQDIASRMLDKYRAGDGAKLLRHYAKVVRADRARARAAKLRKAEAKAPSARLVHIDDLYARWETKQKRAANAMKKLRRQRNGILAAAARAAKGGAK